MAKREGGQVVSARFFIPVDVNNPRSQIAVSTAILALEEGEGFGKLAAIPGVTTIKMTHRYTTRAAAEAGTAEDGQVDIEDAIADASAGQAGEVTVDVVQPDPVDPVETTSVGAEQTADTEEAATGQRRRRA